MSLSLDKILQKIEHSQIELSQGMRDGTKKFGL